MIYTVALFPKGRKVDKAPAIYFESKEEKENYVVAEGLFCLEVYNDYLSSSYGVREKYQKALDKKRITFAKQNNFAPSKGNKFMWRKQDASGGDEPKRYA